MVIIEEEENLAGGLLIGKSLLNNFAVVARLYVIFGQEVGRFQWLWLRFFWPGVDSMIMV